MIERCKTNSIERFSGSAAVFALLEQTARPRDPVSRMKILELLDRLLTKVPVWKLRCNMDPEAVVIAYQAMSRLEYKDKN